MGVHSLIIFTVFVSQCYVSLNGRLIDHFRPRRIFSINNLHRDRSNIGININNAVSNASDVSHDILNINTANTIATALPAVTYYSLHSNRANHSSITSANALQIPALAAKSLPLTVFLSIHGLSDKINVRLSEYFSLTGIYSPQVRRVYKTLGLIAVFGCIGSFAVEKLVDTLEGFSDTTVSIDDADLENFAYSDITFRTNNSLYPSLLDNIVDCALQLPCFSRDIRSYISELEQVTDLCSGAKPIFEAYKSNEEENNTLIKRVNTLKIRKNYVKLRHLRYQLLSSANLCEDHLSKLKFLLKQSTSKLIRQRCMASILSPLFSAMKRVNVFIPSRVSRVMSECIQPFSDWTKSIISRLSNRNISLGLVDKVRNLENVLAVLYRNSGCIHMALHNCKICQTDPEQEELWLNQSSEIILASLSDIQCFGSSNRVEDINSLSSDIQTYLTKSGVLSKPSFEFDAIATFLRKLFSVNLWLRWWMIGGIVFGGMKSIQKPREAALFRDTVINNVSNFVTRRVIVPSTRILSGVFLTRRSSIIDKATVRDAQLSLSNMIYDFLEQETPKLNDIERKRVSRALDMQAVSSAYERALRHPLRNLLSGRIARIVLIQMQYLKKNFLQAISSLDELFNANHINMQLLAFAPALLIAIMAQVFAFTVLYGIKLSIRGRIAESAHEGAKNLRKHVRLLESSLFHELNTRKYGSLDQSRYEEISEGKMLSSLFRIQTLLLMHTQHFTSAVLQSIQEDFRMVAIHGMSPSDRLDMITRIKNRYACLQTPLSRDQFPWSEGQLY